MTYVDHSDFLNARTTDGKTALALAVVKGWRDIAAFLCASGADVDSADRTLRETPLHWAERFGDGNCIRVLLAHSADVDFTNGEGRKPMHELDMLTSQRKPPLHDMVASNVRKFRIERKIQMVDSRYLVGKARM